MRDRRRKHLTVCGQNIPTYRLLRQNILPLGIVGVVDHLCTVVIYIVE